MVELKMMYKHYLGNTAYSTDCITTLTASKDFSLANSGSDFDLKWNTRSGPEFGPSK